MPFYDFECRNSHRFELKQSFSAEPMAPCPTCGVRARRLISLVPVHYKGSGFYVNDYAKKGAASEAKSESGESKSEPKGEPKAEAQKNESGSKEIAASKDTGTKEASAKEKAPTSKAKEPAKVGSD